jgi:hypothetical protein
MPVPISVGDAILLSQIAYNLGLALTSGRKAASAEFSEIQNLLYTLSRALKLLAHDLRNEESTKADQSSKLREETDGEDTTLPQMIMNCRGMLMHLENLVAEYKDIDVKLNPQKAERRWKEEAWINWKKLLWTKESDEIAKIKLSLTTHINGINLAVGAINKWVALSAINSVH